MLQRYGLTEASPVVSVNALGDIDPETLGRPLANLDAQIGDHVRILVREPSVMLGYWRDDDATARAIDRGAWLPTGDLGE